MELHKINTSQNLVKNNHGNTPVQKPNKEKAKKSQKSRVPSNRPPHSVVLSKSELERLRSASNVRTVEEKWAEIQLKESEKKKIEYESQERKRLLKEIDSAKNKVSKSIEEQDKIKYDEDADSKVLDRALLIKQEDEEEIKHANRIILAAKCHLIRDAQIAEKNEMAAELRKEELRLEKLMEEQRIKKVIEEEQKIKNKLEINAKHAREIQDQLKRKETLGLIEAQQIEQEAKQIVQTKLAIEHEEKMKSKAKRETTVKLRSDLQKVEELTALFKKFEFDQQRAAEMKMQEYMVVKDERAKKLSLEKKVSKESLERLQERLVLQQQKLLDTKNKQIEMSIRREQERKEREFREKEKEAILKRKKLEKEVTDARMMQLTDLKYRQSIQMAREETYIKEAIAKLKDEENKEKGIQSIRMQERAKYRADIIKQINDREIERRELQQKSKDEFNKKQEQEKIREQNIRKYLEAKLKAMHNANMPSKFIIEVEKQLKVGGAL